MLRLQSEDLVWYRHLEFQAQNDAEVPRRCFEYNSSRLILHYDRAVFTTVLYLLPGADKNVPDAFRLYVGDRLAYEWRFDVVRLWEIDAEVALRSGKAGPLALVPLMRGGDEPTRADLVAEFHPAVAADLIPVVEVCDKAESLRSWILQCAKLPDGAFVTLVIGKPPVRVASARTTRPSRRSAKRR